ncbi:MAG TPA: hypothetical protein DHV53_08435 [Gammaproteobacteria bacterium]|nr:hypothetical protein [Gammaproteobacteria bacterium]HBQ00832.1 hypothetical protein [Gammaproteobacteria bacterium]HCI88662.1 hypothetical protein [Gammaproteobacteria bacterium]
MRYLTLLFLAMLCSGTTLAQLATPDESGIAYGHMHLNVSSIDQHLPIWTEHFGGEEIAIGPLRAVKFPNMIVMFAEQTPAMGSRETVMDHFGFKVRNIQRFIDKWEAAGFEMGRVFTGAEGQINAYVTLPDGVYVELQEDQGLREEFTGYHVHYFTSQYEELLDWYVEIFGLEIRPRGTIATTTNVPGSNLSFGNSNSPRAPTLGTAIDHVGFEITNLEDFCRSLAERGIEFEVPYREIEALGLAVAFFTDPSGVRIELTEGLDAF